MGSRGTTSPEFSTLHAAGNLGKILRSGVTSIACPGGTWFIDLALRDAVEAGLIEGPRINCAGRFIITYGSIIDSEPSCVGTPDHLIGKLCNNADDMNTEVRRQCKHGVNFIKMADSHYGETQTISSSIPVLDCTAFNRLKQGSLTLCPTAYSHSQGNNRYSYYSHERLPFKRGRIC